ncbi:MAG: hypothetical protein QOJ26_1313 [Thermoplasmata archaeon]|jgi:uncharacterized protein (DUF2164 family)|nr:hypothetical protein [Thermoplasmata archaeon]
MDLPKEDRADAVARIQRYFREERGAELGDLAAGLLLDFITAELGPAIYNRGVKDAKALAQRFAGTLEEELDSLQMLDKPSKRRRRAP